MNGAVNQKVKDANMADEHFVVASEAEKEHLIEIRKSKSTNNAMKQWIATFKQFLKQEEYKELEQISNEELGGIMDSFYTSLCTLKGEKYKSSTLKAMRAALNRYFKDTRGIDITLEKPFVKANELFMGLLKENKQEGRGTIEHKKILTEEDKSKLFEYFKMKMKEAVPDPKIIQQICIFNIIYYMGCRGRENLRSMQKDMFSVKTGQNSDISPTVKNFGELCKIFSKNKGQVIYHLKGHPMRITKK